MLGKKKNLNLDIEQLNVKNLTLMEQEEVSCRLETLEDEVKLLREEVEDINEKVDTYHPEDK